MTWNYFRRLGYWAQVLMEVRGDGAREALKLYLSALAAPVTALRRLDEWGNPALLLDTQVRVADSDRFRCRRNSDDLWHVVPSGQGGVRKALVECLKSGGVFVDAGANIGAFTVLGARLVGSHGCVIAIEMMPDIARRLRDHLELNGLGWVRVVAGASLPHLHSMRRCSGSVSKTVDSMSRRFWTASRAWRRCSSPIHSCG